MYNDVVLENVSPIRFVPLSRCCFCRDVLLLLFFAVRVVQFRHDFVFTHFSKCGLTDNVIVKTCRYFGMYCVLTKCISF